ncbi:MAG TPA: aldo/keto reductase [Candidatus Avibacteroides avistercoris]|uniref:Aldo/keto reductase n=1 Tax=Candidatus Avibacteroides avistercoris TaxID=2840690 RepID=A0A9D2UHH4_9BACT|nr:aldo/keto reductase [Candidatus Avibacteroides avistercoris]
MEYIRLNNGVEVPLLGYGVFLVSPDQCERCVSEALEVGYRHIDTAQAYYNEEGVGQAISKSGIDRNELFITTKVWISNAGEAKAARSIDESLRKLHTDYIDLLLIHQAYGDIYGSWRAMENALRDGKVRAIGVSNFQAGRFVDFAMHVDVKPAMNQLQCNVMVQQNGIQQYLDQYGTRMTAWGPLGGQGADAIFTNPLLQQIGGKHGKTPAQVALRWLTQRGIVAIPKSTRIERMRENFNIFDFRLTDDEMAQIASLNTHNDGTIRFNDPQFIKMLVETYG